MTNTGSVDSRFRGRNRLIWILVIMFLHVLGTIVYVAVGRPAAAR
jgi:hypothetical protein